MQTAAAALLNRSWLVSSETVEAMYQGVVDHLSDFAKPPPGGSASSSCPLQLALRRQRVGRQELGRQQCKQSCRWLRVEARSRGEPSSPAPPLLLLLLWCRCCLPRRTGLSLLTTWDQGWTSPLLLQWPLWIYCYTCNFTLDSKKMAYHVKNGHCLSCFNRVRSLWPDCPLHNRCARQNPWALAYTD